MADNRWKIVGVQAVSTTEVLAYLPEYKRGQPIVRLIRATGNHASSKLTIYVPEERYKGKISVAATAAATDYYVPADSTGGTAFNGLTPTTSDYILLPGSSGWVLEAITAVAAEAGEDYFKISVGTTSGKALTVRDNFFIIREETAHDVTVGNTTIEKLTFPIVGDPGVPMVVSATSGDATDTDVLVSFEYLNAVGIQ